MVSSSTMIKRCGKRKRIIFDTGIDRKEFIWSLYWDNSEIHIDSVTKPVKYPSLFNIGTRFNPWRARSSNADKVDEPWTNDGIALAAWVSVVCNVSIVSFKTVKALQSLKSSRSHKSPNINSQQWHEHYAWVLTQDHGLIECKTFDSTPILPNLNLSCNLKLDFQMGLRKHRHKSIAINDHGMHFTVCQAWMQVSPSLLPCPTSP